MEFNIPSHRGEEIGGEEGGNQVQSQRKGLFVGMVNGVAKGWVYSNWARSLEFEFFLLFFF